MQVKEKLDHIKSSLPSGVRLVAVSKTKPIELILEAYEAGQRDFGENYVQELLEKQEQLPKDIRWHFIGHLQSNKVKYLAPFVHLIHGIDSLKLLQEVNKQALKNNRIINCLLQLHITNEATKFGLSSQECESIVGHGLLAQLKNVHVEGLMAMSTNTEDEQLIRKEYKWLKTFQNKLLKVDSGLTTLSMGMSGDYQIAIEEGSNMIRVGSSLFGNRNYNI